MTNTLRIPVGPIPLLVDVPEDCYAVLWGSVPFAVDHALVFRPALCSLLAERTNHVERCRRLAVKAINDDRFGFVEVTFRREFPRRAAVKHSERKGDQACV